MNPSATCTGRSDGRPGNTRTEPDACATRRDAGKGLRVRNLSQADLAHMIGTSRESVSRALGRWEREELVGSGQRWVEIRDAGGAPRRRSVLDPLS